MYDPLALDRVRLEQELLRRRVRAASELARIERGHREEAAAGPGPRGGRFRLTLSARPRWRPRRAA